MEYLADAHNYWMEERDDQMQGKWQSAYDDYLKEIKALENTDPQEPLSFDEFWRECEANA